jgi:hypothetical protein
MVSFWHTSVEVEVASNNVAFVDKKKEDLNDALEKSKAKELLFKEDVAKTEAERLKFLKKPKVKQMEVKLKKADLVQDPMAAIRAAERMIEDQLQDIVRAQMEEEVSASAAAEIREIKDMGDEELRQRLKGDWFYGVESLDEVNDRKRRVKAREMKQAQMDMVRMKQNELLEMMRLEEDKKRSLAELELMTKEEQAQVLIKQMTTGMFISYTYVVF